VFSSRYCLVKIKNTPAWIKATAISRRNKTRSNRRVRLPNFLTLRASQTTQEQRKIRRWPARRLDPNRKPRVIGWMRSLILSIKAINGIKKIGVPLGTRWLNLDRQLYNKPTS